MSFLKELADELSKTDQKKYAHGHLYYICGVITLTLFFISFVQAVIIHVEAIKLNTGGLVWVALFEYFIAVMLLIVTLRCFHRGHGHYKYPPHK